MAGFYWSADRSQQMLLPPCVADYVSPDHPVWFVLDVVDMVDMSAFHGEYVDGGVGRPAYDPAVMLAVLIWAYANGVKSSRKIAVACQKDLAFMAICGALRPDFRTIARFRQVHENALRDVFCEVLRVCQKCGLVNLGTIAIDGTKIAANASLRKNRSKSWIEAKVDEILAEAAQADQQAQLDGTDNEQLPGALGSPGGRRERLMAALAEIRAEQAIAEAERDVKLDKQRTEAKKGQKPKGPVPKSPSGALDRAETSLLAAEARLSKANSSSEQDKAFTLLSEAIEGVRTAAVAMAEAEPEPERQANITDPESRILPTAKDGWVQGYNAQNIVTEAQVIVAAFVSNHANDVEELVPTLEQMGMNLAYVGSSPSEIGMLLADAGYWSETNATTEGLDCLIATQKDWKQRRAARELGQTSGPPPDDVSLTEQMEHRLRTPEGAAAYKKRSGMIEPVFGQTKENQGIRRFSRRGLDAARSEWSFIGAVHNIKKLMTYANGRPLHALLGLPN